jgi:GDPmannose 4,6-dehydratase
MKKRALITGITGQDGTYLSKLLLEKDYEVYGFVSRRVNQSFNNLDYFGITNNIKFVFGDITDISSINQALDVSRPHEVYNLASMSFVGLGWQEPIHISHVNALGPLHLLEAVKHSYPDAKVYQASSSEMFGNSMEDDNTQNELTAFIPRSPYGFAKVFAHNAIVNYRESYSMFACSGILFNHESPIRGKQFVTRKITDGVARIKAGLQNHIELGDLDVRRDWGFAGDYVEAMWLMMQQDEPDDYIISTGKNWSIKELLEVAFNTVGIPDWKPYVKQNSVYMRPPELYHLKGNPIKAKEKLGWESKTTFNELIKLMIEADIERYEH